MSNRGIFTHGPLKAFLTRGLFRNVFRPLLYGKLDHIHWNFIEVFNNEIMTLDNGLTEEHKKIVFFWHCLTPMNFFDTIFVKDSRGETLLPQVFDNAQNTNGAECAYLTQAFTLFMLGQFLKNDSEYADHIRLPISEFEKVTTFAFGEKNKTLAYLQNFRNKFDTKKLEFDPRDWSLEYVWNVCSVLIPETDVLAKAMGAWDEDILGKMQLIGFATEYFVECKKESLRMI